MRTFDATLFNEIANDPFIRPRLGGTGEIDLTNALLDPNNYAFTNGRGGFVVIDLVKGTGRFECHTLFRHDTDYRKIIRMMVEAQDYMFTHTNCTEIVTKVPEGNKGAGSLASIGNFVEVAKGPEGTSYRSLTLDRWAGACSTALEAGKAFHGLLENAKKATGSALPVHNDDDLHDRWVGAAVLMTKAGNVVKGVNTYNKWASFFGYAPVRLLSEQPPVVDLHDAVIGLNGSELEVLLCR